MQIQSFGLGQPVVEQSVEVLGGKGAGLVQMTAKGLPVPPGFILPTTLYAEYKAKPKTVLKQIEKEIGPWLDKLKQHFGYMPLVSVRSGARVSCPGMMDTILNVGLDQTSEKLWREKLGEQCYRDSWHRLIVMYGSVVTGLDRHALEAMTPEEALVAHSNATGQPFPSAKQQILGSVGAVFDSWNNERAKFYRKMNNIPDEWGTACVIQAMVFGNLNMHSGSGVVFSRDCDTGLAKINGDFLPGGQGEDVVAGIKTAPKLKEIENWNPELYQQIVKGVVALEEWKKDVVDVEITVQDGKLYYLQVRSAQRTAAAAVKIAIDMVEEQLLTPKEGIARVGAKNFDLARQPVIDPKFTTQPFAQGISACSGVVTGKIVFSAKDAVASKVPCILVTNETTPDDIEGMHAARGVVTMQGGSTSHAAVVARGMNKPCVVGVGLDLQKFKNLIGNLSIDGQSGKMWIGDVPVVACDPEVVAKFEALMCSTLGYVPIITEAPVKKIACAYTMLGHRMLDPHGCVEYLQSLSKKVGLVYVDFDSHDSPTASYLAQVGGADHQAVLKELADHEQFIGNIVLVGAKHKKFKSVGQATDLESLILAGDGVLMNGEPTEAVKKVLGWKKAEGLKVLSIGVLDSTSTSFLTFEQALQLV